MSSPFSTSPPSGPASSGTPTHSYNRPTVARVAREEQSSLEQHLSFASLPGSSASSEPTVIKVALEGPSALEQYVSLLTAIIMSSSSSTSPPGSLASSRPHDTKATPRNLRSLERSSGIERYLAQSANEDPFRAGGGPLVFSRALVARSEAPSNTSILPWRKTPQPERLTTVEREPARPEYPDRAHRLLIYQAIVKKFMINGSGAHLSSRVAGMGEQVGLGGACTTSSPSPVTTRSQKRAVEESEPDQGASDSSKSAGLETGCKIKRRLTDRKPRQYACPFYRKDPDSRDYATGGKYEKCSSQGIKTDKLKEHIRRIHTKPAQCPKCGYRGDPGGIKHHLQHIPCVQNRSIEEVDRKTILTERLLTSRRNTSWHQVFAILFPDHRPTPPDSAQYFGDECELSYQGHLQILATHLEQSAAALETLLQSPEYNRIASGNLYLTSESPAVVAAAARLMAIISSGPFVASPSTSASPDSGATAVAESDRNLNIQLATTPLLNPAPDAPSPNVGLARGNNTVVNQHGTGEIPPQHLDDDWETMDYDFLVDDGWSDPPLFDD